MAEFFSEVWARALALLALAAVLLLPYAIIHFLVKYW